MGKFLSIVLVLTGLSFSVFAKKTNQTLNYTVYSENYPKEQLDGPVNASTQETAVLNPGKRDVILDQAGLTKYVTSWDHLEKDLLILRASKNSKSALRSKYPKIPPSALQQLQVLLKETK